MTKKITAVVFAILIFLYPRPLDYGFVSAQVEKFLERAIGMEAEISGLRYLGLDGVELSGVRIYDSETQIEVLSVRKMFIGYQLDELARLKGQRVRRIAVEDPTLKLTPRIIEKLRSHFQPNQVVHEMEQEFKVPVGKALKEKKEFRVDQILLVNGNLSMETGGKTMESKNVSLAVTDLTQSGMQQAKFHADLFLQKKPAGEMHFETAAVNWETHAMGAMRLNFKDVDLSQVFTVISPWLPQKIKGAKLSGKLNLNWENAGGESGGQGKVTLSGFNAEDSTGGYALAGFGVKGTFQTRHGAGFSDVSVDGNSRVTFGQLLLGAFYHDFQNKTGDMKFDINGNRERNSISLKNLSIKLPQFAEFELTGDIPDRRAPLQKNHWKGAIRLQALEKAPEWGGGGLLNSLLPAFPADIQAAGDLAVAFDATGDLPKNFRMETDVSSKKLSVTSESLRLFLHDAAISMPLSFLFNPDLKISAKKEISIDSQSFGRGFLKFGASKIRARLNSNHLELVEPVRLPIYSGEVLLPDLKIGDIRQPMLDLRASLRAKNINLRTLSQELGIAQFTGTIEAELPKIEIGEGHMFTQGSILAKAFEGQIEIKDFWGRDLGSANRRFGFDTRFWKLNLGYLSRLTNFGYINGILNGSILGLEIYGTDPVAFELDMFTPPAPGFVDYKIGIEAVKKIAIFSGASQALQFLDSGIYKMIDSYNYEALAIQASLRHDRLRLTPRLRRGDKTLLLKGSRLPPRIDIVYEGSGDILFQTFLNQIKAVQLRMRKENENEASN